MRTHIQVLWIVLCLASTSLGETTVKIDFVTLTLPDGYLNTPRRGIDSEVGDITIQGKPFSIRYDSFGWGNPRNFSDFPKELLDSIIYYERAQEDIPTNLYVWTRPGAGIKRTVTLMVLASGAKFNIDLPDSSSVQDALAMLRAIKVIKAASIPR